MSLLVIHHRMEATVCGWRVLTYSDAAGCGSPAVALSLLPPSGQSSPSAFGSLMEEDAEDIVTTLTGISLCVL